MDPVAAFGLAAGLFQIVGIATKASSGLHHAIHTFRHAVDEMAQLSNEVSDLRLVLSEVDVISQEANVKQQEEVVAGAGASDQKPCAEIPESEQQHAEESEQSATTDESPGKAVSPLKIAVQRISLILQEIHTTISKLNQDSAKLGALRRNHARWVTVKSKMNELRNSLREQKLGLIMGLNLGVQSNVIRIDIDIKEILVRTRNHSMQQEEFFVQMAGELSRQRAQLDRLYAQSVLFNPSQFAQQIVQDAPSGAMRLDQDGLHFPRPASPSDKIEYSAGTIAFEIANRHRKACPVTCTCQCHLERSFRTPTILDNLFGRLFIGYTGLPVRSSFCDVASCKQRPPFSARLLYHFPPWFIGRLISAGAVFNQDPTSIESVIRVKNVIALNAPVLYMAVVGDIDGMKMQFSTGKARPNDVERHGVTFSPLFHAIVRRNVESCKFLLDAGADPLAEDELGYSSIDHAWSAVLGRALDPDVLEYFKSAFLSRDSCQFSKRRFTILHKIVLGLAGRSRILLRELELTTLNINTTDTLLRTPLSWAVERGQLDDVRTLLEFGADPNIRDFRGNTVLDYCGSSAHKSALTISRLLLKHEADPDIVNNWGLNFLSVIACFQTDPVWLEQLYARPGFDIDYYIPEQRATPTAFAIAKNTFSLFKSLIDHGADLEFRDAFGYTPFLLTVYHDRPDMLIYLLSRKPGPDTLVVSKDGDNVAHLAAIRCGPETMRVLAEANIANINPDAKNHSGFTATDLLRQRLSITPGLIGAFQAFINSLAARQYETFPDAFFLGEEITRAQTPDSAAALYYDARTQLYGEEQDDSQDVSLKGKEPAVSSAPAEPATESLFSQGDIYD